jgi:hypothetical protein
MKASFFALCGLLFLFSCNSSTGESSITRINYLKDTFYFGNIKKGDTVAAVFEYENTGNMPLKIINIAASCGCSKPVFDTTFLLPGLKKSFQLIYNSKDDTGNIVKSLVVESNTDPRLKVLYISGSVQ